MKLDTPRHGNKIQNSSPGSELRAAVYSSLQKKVLEEWLMSLKGEKRAPNEMHDFAANLG